MHLIKQAIDDIRAGKMVVVTDDEFRENEGDLIMAGELVTPAAINFMVKEGRGLICLAMSPEKIDNLQLPFMHPRQEDDLSTAFTVSIDATYGISTGISASDRARTIRVASSSDACPADIVIPGHIMPLRARQKGVLERPGHTEAAVDLARLAGLEQAAAICEIMAPDGEMLRGSALMAFAKQHNLTFITIKDLIHYRQHHDTATTKPHKIAPRVIKTASCQLQTKWGIFTMQVFRDVITQREHVALVHGELATHEMPLIRLHSSCLTGDVLGSLYCDCGDQLQQALQKIVEAGCGALIYLDQEGRGIGLTNKVKAYALQQQGHDTVSANVELGLPADSRDYGMAAEILQQLGVKKIRLLTNNPHKLSTLAGLLQQPVERVSLQVASHPACRQYLQAKRDRLGHILDLPPE